MYFLLVDSFYIFMYAIHFRIPAREEFCIKARSGWYRKKVGHRFRNRQIDENVRCIGSSISIDNDNILFLAAKNKIYTDA